AFAWVDASLSIQRPSKKSTGMFIVGMASCLASPCPWKKQLKSKPFQAAFSVRYGAQNEMCVERMAA
ncbi:MAG: hypothetical protein IKN06_12660, partial [Bacteroidales bacterium]|nr:hypothetical protein [Bacteroidales bacterium]